MLILEEQRERRGRVRFRLGIRCCISKFKRKGIAWITIMRGNVSKHFEKNVLLVAMELVMFLLNHAHAAAHGEITFQLNSIQEFYDSKKS